MIKLIDTFNDHLISQHRTVLAAVKAQMAHSRAIRRRYGSNSYLTYSIRRQNGKEVEEHEVIRAEADLRRW